MVTKYPEHEKLKLVKDKSQLIGEFISEWLPSQGYTICETYNDPDSLRDGEFLPARVRPEELLARFFDIDLKKIEEEKRAMLEEQRRLNESDKKWSGADDDGA